MMQEIEKLSNQATTLIKSQPKGTRFRVISHYDADGMTAAAIISIALQREEYRFHTTLMRNPFTTGLERLKEEKNTFIIFTDMGSGQLPYIEQLSANCIIIDHHQAISKDTADHILQINANLCGINGNTEACGATLSFKVATALNKNNQDLVGLALAGATGDKQYIGGFTGLNKQILKEALSQKHLDTHIGLKMPQVPLIDAISHSIEPFYPGLSGHGDNTQKFLRHLSFDTKKSYTELSKKEQNMLHSALLFVLLCHGCESNILDTVIRDRYYSDLTFGELEQFADLLDACGKFGSRDLGLAICLGDNELLQQARIVEQSFKQQILQELLTLEKEGPQETQSFRYFYASNSSLGGVIGGIAINYLLDKEKPLFSFVKKTDELHVSCRGNHYLVENGLDLGSAMKEVAQKIGGHGGGHKIAAGATLPADKEEFFLQNVENILSKQLHKNGG